MTRYFMFFSFRGTAYNGWQVQPGKHTVQGVLTKALGTVLGEQVCNNGGWQDRHRSACFIFLCTF